MNDNEAQQSETDRTPLGDARPDNTKNDPRTGGSLPQEDVEERPNVSTVTPRRLSSRGPRDIPTGLRSRSDIVKPLGIIAQSACHVIDFGDPYGNRTRVSAVKGPRPNR